jgi:outer membrane lipoprotein-sorting protein
VNARLPIYLLALSSAAPASAAATAAPDARAQYEQALAHVAHVRSLEFQETVKVLNGTRRTVRTHISFLAPHRSRMVVTTLAPRPVQTLKTVQVGRVRCQAPPGVCFRAPPPTVPIATIRALLVPKLPVTYRATTDPARGFVIIKLGARSKGGRYSARLVIDAARGLPVRFSSAVTDEGHVYASQEATFDYRGKFKIKLPAGARVGHG